MSGTKSISIGQSDTDKQILNDFSALATAMQEGKMDEVDRLMAVEEEPKEPIETPEEEDKAPDPEPETPEEEPSKEETLEEEPSKDEEEVPQKPEKADVKESKGAAKAAPADKQDETLEELKQRLHRAQSDAGRVPYLQRELAVLQRELRAQRARATEDASDGKTAKTVGRIDDVELDPETKEKIGALRDIDPVMADALERSTKAAIFHSNSRVDHAVTTLTEEDQRADDERFYIEQKAILSSRVPQADAIFASPEWKQWKESLTPGYRAIAESPYANEVEQAIRAFAADMQRLNGGQATLVQEQEEIPAALENKEVKETRERKISGAAEAKAPAAKVTKQLDENAVFEEFYKDIGKRDHIL